jgi:hypothetical protein
LTALNDEKAWSENFGPFCLAGRKSDWFDRKVGDIRKSGRDDRFYRSSGKGLEFRALNVKRFWLGLEVVRQDIWTGNMTIATTIQMLGNEFQSQQRFID